MYHKNIMIYKLLLNLLIIFSLIKTVSAQTSIDGYFIKAGLDFFGNATAEDIDYGEESEEDVDTGFSIAGERIYDLDIIGLGFGIKFELPRSADIEDVNGKFFNVPVYGLLTICLNNNNGMYMYLTGHIGINLMWESYEINGDKNEYDGYSLEPYMGFGFGILYSNDVQVELLYSVKKGEVFVDSNNEDDYIGLYVFEVEYSNFTLSAGYRF